MNFVAFCYGARYSSGGRKLRRAESKFWRAAPLAPKKGVDGPMYSCCPHCGPGCQASVDHHAAQRSPSENPVPSSSFTQMRKHTAVCFRLLRGLLLKPSIGYNFGSSFKMHRWVSSRSSDPPFQNFSNFWSQDTFVN